jgi:hypothetical protein
MGALTDLKSLVFKGPLTKEVVLVVDSPVDPTQPLIPATKREFKFKLVTMSVIDELSAMEKSGLLDAPTTPAELVKSIYANLCFAIKAVNDEPVTDIAELDAVLNSLASDVIASLWEEYKKLDVRVSAAGVELKNL